MEASAASLDHRCRLPQDGRASHAYLHALIENNPTAVVVLDSTHDFKMCNAAFARLFQYESSDLETWGIDALIAGPDFLEEASKATHAVLLGKQVRLRSKRRRRDGRLIDVDIYGVPLMLDGRVEGVFGLYQDLTGHIETAEALPEITAHWPRTRDAEPLRSTPSLYHSLSQELALLNWNLNRLGKLLPMESDDAKAVLHKTRELATLCGDQARSVEKHFFDAAKDATLSRGLGSADTPHAASLRPQSMTERETEIVKLLAAGLSSKEVACRLAIGTRTVETHRMNIYRKLQLRNIADLVLYAIRNGLLSVG